MRFQRIALFLHGINIRKLKIKRIINDTFKIALSLFLGGAILYWMYRGFDFKQVEHVMLHEMNWAWMLLSFPFGVMAQVFRGWRWRQSLEPLGEKPRTSTAVHAIFVSYAVSLIIPRIGEFARCAVLRRYDKTDFAKALGTVVTERAIDSLLVLLVAAITLLTQVSIFNSFFNKTGTSLTAIFGQFSTTGYVVTAICAVAVMVLLHFLLKRMSIYNKVKETVKGIWQGVNSIRNVRNKWLFAFFTLAIWGSYFLHYYLTFFCFEATAGLGVACAMVTFVIGSMAVVVPTPNGAGPWHFAVKTMLILYAVDSTDALNFVLIVHSVQTLLVILLGVYGWMALAFSRSKPATTE